MAAWNRKTPPASQQNSSDNHNDAAIARINSAIADENAKINKLYLEIGKKYVETHTEEYEEGFSDLIKAVTASQKKLADYSLQMQFVTGIIVCTNCGHKAPKGSVFCNMCGSKLPELNLDHFEMCSQCGSLVEKGQKLCPNCSHPMESADSSAVQCPHCKEFVEKENKFCSICGWALPYDGTAQPPYDKPSGRKCPRCGAIMNDNMRFCTECGSKLDHQGAEVLNRIGGEKNVLL
ncbi:MAG: zinc ribbon domain-containing protein [Faecousia sp.]